MRPIRLLPAGRPVLVAITLFLAGSISATLVLGMTLSYAQQQQSAGLSFSSDAGLIFSIIKPDQTAAFEATITKLKEAFTKMDPDKIEDPEQKKLAAARKQQAASWIVYKQVEPGPNGTVLYVSVLQPAVKEADYGVMKIIAEAFPAEAQELYKSYSAAFVSLSRTNLQKIAEFK